MTDNIKLPPKPTPMFHAYEYWDGWRTNPTWNGDRPKSSTGLHTDEILEAYAREAVRLNATVPDYCDVSCTTHDLASMILSDCGCSSNYQPLLDRVAARIEKHIEAVRLNAQGVPDGYALVPVDAMKRWRDAFAEELSAWDIDPPLHHVQTSHDEIEAMLLAAPVHPGDDAVFELWWADHMPNASQADAWAEWCSLRANQPKPHPAAQQGDALSYVHPVPDHCDRVVWRNRYIHLAAQAQEAAPAAPQPARTALEQYDLEQSEDYRKGYDDGRKKGYEVGYRQATEHAAMKSPPTQPLTDEKDALLRQALGALEAYSKSGYVRHEHPKKYAAGDAVAEAIRNHLGVKP